ncbi:hypothetical protein [Pseudomonas sp. A014]|uniref:hypothetical protein n=1 Tax=Pseudomonas sp. A014 TaxID=3458058 RepID=UPI0040363CD6
MRKNNLPPPEAGNVQYYLPDRSSGLQLKVNPVSEARVHDDILVYLDQSLIFRVPVPADWVVPLIFNIPDSSLSPDGVYQLQYAVSDRFSEDSYPSDPVTIIIGPMST